MRGVGVGIYLFRIGLDEMCSCTIYTVELASCCGSESTCGRRAVLVAYVCQESGTARATGTCIIFV